MTKKMLLVICLVCSSAMHNILGAERAKPNPYSQIMLGYGASHPGLGMTTERVLTLDIIPRHCRHFFDKESGWIRGAHEFWIETPISLVISDSDSNDRHDFGIVGLNFLFAWVFPEIAIGNPYFMIGGGPQYVFADIEGVGSDLCGNYQVGCGIRFNLLENHPLNLEVRYHHISNLGMSDSNISLNSSKLAVGLMLPF